MARGFVVRPRGRAAIRRVAAGIREHLGLDSRSIPIVHVLEKVLPELYPEYSFQVYDKLEMEERFGPGNYGITLHCEDAIILRDDVYARALNGAPRDRFTAAHELGHYLLHKEEGLAMPKRSNEKIPYYRDSEWQANTFAGEFLVDTKNLIALDLMHVEDIRVAFGVSLKTAAIQCAEAKKMAIEELQLQ